MNETGRIVVGIDGSASAREALRWALDEAERRGCLVEAVHAWDYPALSYLPGVVPTPVFAEGDLEAEARATLDETVEDVLADTPAAARVRRVIVHASPLEGLAAQSAGADMLVLGHRGRGAFRELLLGSVAKQCATHPPCPVVIIPPAAAVTSRSLVDAGDSATRSAGRSS